METSFRAKQGERQPYTVDAVWFYTLNKGLGTAKYILKCREAKIPRVAYLDTKELLEYMEGRTTASEQIDKELATVAIPAPTQDERPSKRARKAGVVEELEMTDELRRDQDVFAGRLEGLSSAPDIEGARASRVIEGGGEEGSWRAAGERLVGERGDVVVAAVELGEAERRFMDAERDVTESVVARELKHNDRCSVLRANNSRDEPFASVLATYQKVIKMEDAEQKKEEEMQDDKKKAKEKKRAERNSSKAKAASGGSGGSSSSSSSRSGSKSGSSSSSSSSSSRSGSSRDKGRGGSKTRVGKPIIMVPKMTGSSLLSQFNTPDFLTKVCTAAATLYHSHSVFNSV